MKIDRRTVQEKLTRIQLRTDRLLTHVRECYARALEAKQAEREAAAEFASLTPPRNSEAAATFLARPVDQIASASDAELLAHRIHPAQFRAWIDAWQRQAQHARRAQAIRAEVDALQPEAQAAVALREKCEQFARDLGVSL